MRSKMENMLDNTDDVWTAFAELMNQVEIVVFEFAYLFPKCKKTQSVKYPMPIGKLPEYSALTGFHVFASNALTNCEFFTSEHAEPVRHITYSIKKNLCFCMPFFYSVVRKFVSQEKNDYVPAVLFFCLL